MALEPPSYVVGVEYSGKDGEEGGLVEDEENGSDGW